MAPRHALYRLFDSDGKLLYVGETNNPDRRLEQHRKNKPWNQVASIAVAWLENREVALMAERAAIEVERPTWNVAHNAQWWYAPGTIIGIAVTRYRKPIAHIGTVVFWNKKAMSLSVLDSDEQKTITLSDIRCLRTGSIEDVCAFRREWEEGA